MAGRDRASGADGFLRRREASGTQRIYAYVPATPARSWRMPETDQTRLRKGQARRRAIRAARNLFWSRGLPVTELPAEFMERRGNQHAVFGTYNIVDDLCFTFQRYRPAA